MNKNKTVGYIGLAAFALLAFLISAGLQLPAHRLSSIGYWLSLADLSSAICHLPFLSLGGLALASAPLAFTEEQMKEFTSLLDDLKGGWTRVKELPDLLKRVEDENADLKLELSTLHSKCSQLAKAHLTGVTGNGVRWLNGVPFVSDDCARALASLYILAGEQQGNLKELIQDTSRRERLVAVSSDFLGLQTRTAL